MQICLQLLCCVKRVVQSSNSHKGSRCGRLSEPNVNACLRENHQNETIAGRSRDLLSSAKSQTTKKAKNATLVEKGCNRTDFPNSSLNQSETSSLSCMKLAVAHLLSIMSVFYCTTFGRRMVLLLPKSAQTSQFASRHMAAFAEKLACNGWLHEPAKTGLRATATLASIGQKRLRCSTRHSRIGCGMSSPRRARCCSDQDGDCGRRSGRTIAASRLGLRVWTECQ